MMMGSRSRLAALQLASRASSRASSAAPGASSCCSRRWRSGSAGSGSGSERSGSDMRRPERTLETLRQHPHETPAEINERIFGGFDAYREAKQRGSATPVLDAYGETGDPEMLEKILRLARECLPERTGPRRNNFMHRQNLRQKATRKQHYIMKQQKAAAHERKIAAKQERKSRHAQLVAASLADDLAYRRERQQQEQQQQQV